MSDKHIFYNMVAQNSESTVVAEYTRDVNMVREAGYQSEADLEKAFIKQLQLKIKNKIVMALKAGKLTNGDAVRAFMSEGEIILKKMIVL